MVEGITNHNSRYHPLSAPFSNLGALPNTAREIVLDRAIKPDFSPRHPTPNHALNRETRLESCQTASDLSRKGGIVRRLYDARAVDAKPLVHESPIISLDLYCSLLVEVSPVLSPVPKMELVSEKIESVSVDEDPKRELSEGTCQDGNVASGFTTVFANSVFVAALSFFPSLTYTTTILYDSWQLLHRPAWTILLSLRVRVLHSGQSTKRLRATGSSWLTVFICATASTRESRHSHSVTSAED